MFLPIRRRNFLSGVFILLLVFLSLPAAFAQEETNDSDPIKLFNQGQDAHEKGDLLAAVKFYKQALKANPEFPEAEFQLGAALVTLGQADEAEEAFRRASKLRDDWVLPLASLGSLLIERNKFSEAEAVLSDALKLDEQDAGVLSALTELRLRSKASPEILKSLLVKVTNSSAQENAPASIWAARGALENALGDSIAAKKSLNRALTLDANNLFALAIRSDIALAEKDYAVASEDAQRLVKLVPNSTSAKIRLAGIYAASGNVSEALNILDALDASNPEVAALKNSILATTSDDVPALEKQLEKNPRNASVLGRLCNLTRTANPQKSLDYCRRASEAEPNNLNHAVGFGAALVQAKQFDSAITLFRRLLQIAPHNYFVHANLATALFESKRYADAKTEYIWLSEKKPDLAIAFYFLAISHDQLAEYVEALENYQKFLRLADSKQNQLEIDKVNLRLPAVEKLAKQKGRKQ